MALRRLIWIGCLLVLAQSAGAASVLDALALPQSPERVLPGNLPDSWRAGYVREPVFNSRILMVEAGVGNPETVLLIHGLGQNGHKDWHHVITHLAKRFHVLAIDLPGFGYSDQPEGQYSPGRYARLLYWLYEQTGQERVHLAAHSMGGAVALRFASSFPELLDKLVLVSVAGVLERSAFVQHSSESAVDLNGVPNPVRQAAEDQIRHWSGKLLDLVNRMPDPSEFLKNNNSAWNMLLGDRPNINAALALVDEDFSGALESITVPTLIIWGSADPVAPLRTGELLAGQMPQAELVVFADTGHVPMFRRERFNQLLEGFLTGDRPLEPGFPEPRAEHGDLHCNGTNGGRYRERSFTSVRIVNCKNLTLEHVRAERIELIDSDVIMFDVHVESNEHIALDIVRSNLRMTHGSLVGRVGIHTDGSRLDLAGVSVRGRKSGVVASRGSQFVMSLSELHGPDGKAHLHGIYRLGPPE